MTVNASNLRKNVFRLLDRILETGEPLEVVRRGKKLKIVRAEQPGCVRDRLVRHECIVGDPEELVHMDWSDAWGGERQM
jgi:hypothetical protein